MFFRNKASQKIRVFAYDATTGLPKTGDAANITASVNKDYAGWNDLTDTSATEEDSTKAKGYYLFDATQGESDGEILEIGARSSTSNIVVIGAPATIFTMPATGVLAPATAGRTLVVDASGRALSDLDTIKTNPVVNAGTITFPTGATLASTTNITAAAGCAVSSIGTDVINATALAASAVTEIQSGLATASALATVQSDTDDMQTRLPVALVGGRMDASLGAIASGVDFSSTQKTSIAASVWNAAMASYQAAGSTGLAISELDTIYQNAYDGITARMLANVTHANGVLYSTAITTPLAAVKAKTDQLVFTVANQVDSNVLDWKSATAPAMTGDAFARLGAPAGASVSADLAAINTKTTNLPSDPADASDITAALASLSSHGDSTWATATGFAVAGNAMALTSNERNSLAAVLLRRAMVNIEGDAAGDTLTKSSLYGFIQQAQYSNTTDNAGFLTIKKTTGVELGRLTLATATADPVTGISP